MESRRDLYDVIVVGAGIEGSATAYQLAKKGKDVLLLEQFPLPHSRGSSHGQTRITRKAYGANEYYTAMMTEAFQMLHELEAEAGETLFIPCDFMLMGPETDPYIPATEEALKRFNFSHEMMTAQEWRRRYPNIATPDSFRFLVDKSGGVLRSDKILLAYHKQFVAMGGVLRDGEPMTNVAPGDVVTVTTSKGQYRGRSVVLTLGPWAATFLPKLGLELPLKPVRIGVYYWKEKVPGEFSGLPAFVETRACGGHDIYGLPSFTYPGVVKICCHGGPAIHPDERDAADSQLVLGNMKAYIATRFPTLESTPCIQESCIYTLTPDEDFILDTHPKWTNVVVGAGFSGHGFKLAPVVGKVLGELALGQTPSYDLGHFRMDRFKKARL